MDKVNSKKKEHPFSGGFIEKYCVEHMPESICLDQDILKRFTSIREAFKDEPIRRLPIDRFTK